MEKYERYKDSGVKWIGEIPEHWGMYKLKYLFKLNKNKNIGNKCNTILSLSYGKIKIKKDLNEGLTPESYESYQLLSTGDIVIRSTDLQNDHTSLRTGLVKNEGAITSAYIGLKNLDKNLYDSRFYHYFLHDWDITKAIYNQGKGLRQSLNWDDIKNMLMPVLDISEQTAIANYLDSVTSKIDEAISQQRKMIDLLNERKQIIIQNAVTKGLDPNAKMKDSGVEWIGEIPEHWEKISLKRLFKERVAGSWGEDENKNSQNTVCMRIADFDYAKLSFLNKSQYTIRSYQNKEIGKKKLQKGDLLIEKSGGGEKTPVGRVVLFDLDIKDAMYANFMEKLCVREIALPKYVNFLLSAFYAKGMVWPYIKATTGIQNLDITNLLSKEIVFIPNIITQNKIVDFLGDRTSKIDSSISQCNKMISLLQERKQIIINDVVTGKVKVV